MHEPTDSELVAKARQGDTEAFDGLVIRYRRLAISIAFDILRNWEAAKDTSQNALMKAYFGLKNFRQASTFRTWLIRIVLNEAKNAARKERLQRLFVFWNKDDARNDEEQNLLETIPSPEASPAEKLSVEELKNRLENAIKKLPEKERNVFTLRYVHELPLGDIAGSLHIAEGTVKAHLSHATEKIKRFMEDKETGGSQSAANSPFVAMDPEGGE